MEDINNRNIGRYINQNILNLTLRFFKGNSCLNVIRVYRVIDTVIKRFTFVFSHSQITEMQITEKNVFFLFFETEKLKLNIFPGCINVNNEDNSYFKCDYSLITTFY